MRVRSWMAALALVVGISIAVGRAMPVPETAVQPPEKSNADGAEQPKTPPAAKSTKASPSRIPSVQLSLVIAGLGPKGCDVQVKPGNASCKFSAVYGKRKEDRQFVPSDGRANLELRDVELRGADRTITFAITVHEAGQAPKTFYRGFRLPAQREAKDEQTPATTPSFTCYLSSPSRIARADESRSRR
jgi:hypothetical protein